MEFDFNEKKKIHFIGIGGISMSALAHIMLDRGFKVSGSDTSASQITDELAAAGADIKIGQRAGNITGDIDLVVYTAAIPEDNPELLKARAENIPVMVRADFLGRIMRMYDRAICVSGTHGKTTTTSLLSKIMLDAGCDPTINVGGILPDIGGNYRIGDSGDFLTEACEYTNSFLSFFPDMEIILNVQADHMDFFKDLDDIRSSFKRFTRLLPDDGTLIINGEIDDLSYFTDGLNCSVVTFGLSEDCNFYAKNITYNESACAGFELYAYGVSKGYVRLQIPGKHNVYNALAALAAASCLGIDSDSACAAAADFRGVNRRFQIKGTVCGTTIVDDYSHHPDEIRSALDTALKYPHKKLWVVFQPHTYTRTHAFLEEFADALSLADAVILAEIYAAREKNTLNISSNDLKKLLDKAGVEAYYFPTFDEIENFLLKTLVNGDLLITMGAGDVYIIGDKLLGK